MKRRYAPPHIRHKGENLDGRRGEMPPAEEVGGGEECVLAESVQEAPDQVGEEEGRELPWARPAGLLNHGLSEDNFGIGSKCAPPNNTFS
jgi:hypothetical protein